MSCAFFHASHLLHLHHQLPWTIPFPGMKRATRLRQMSNRTGRYVVIWEGINISIISSIVYHLIPPLGEQVLDFATYILRDLLSLCAVSLVEIKAARLKPRRLAFEPGLHQTKDIKMRPFSFCGVYDLYRSNIDVKCDSLTWSNNNSQENCSKFFVSEYLQNNACGLLIAILSLQIFTSSVNQI